MSQSKGLQNIPEGLQHFEDQRETLLEFGFEFDVETAFQEWSSRTKEPDGSGSNLVKTELIHEIPRINIQIKGVDVQIPEESKALEFSESSEEELEQTSMDPSEKSPENFLEELKKLNPALGLLLKKYPEFIYFFNQSTGYCLSFANEYGLRYLAHPDLDLLMPVRKNQQDLSRRRLDIEEVFDKQNRPKALVITGCSGKKNVNYCYGGDEANPLFTSLFDESVLTLPINPITGKLSGTGSISGVLLLGNPPGQSVQKFEKLVEKIRAEKVHGTLGIALPDREASKLIQAKAEAMSINPSPPTKASLVATPILSAGIFSGAACALILLSVVAPPLGLGLLASALIMAGIGALVGAGIDAFRLHRHSNNKQNVATAFASLGRHGSSSPRIAGPVQQVNLD